MEFKQLRSFVEVVHRGGFTQAAHTLHISQSAVSKQVAQLEQDLGLALLDRHGSQLHLTDAGRIVLERGEAMLRLRQALYNELDDLGQLGRGELRLGLPLLGSDALFAGLFAEFAILLDGSKAACDWDVAPGTPAPGLMPASDQAATTVKSWLTNSNDSYWVSNPAIPHRELSPILGKYATARSLRTRSNFSETAALLAAQLKAAGTIVWNGPVGVFEFAAFENGTKVIAQAIAESTAFSIAGGGDTLAAIAKYGIEKQVGYISTGGGAFLEILEGKTLPAFEILAKRAAG